MQITGVIVSTGMVGLLTAHTLPFQMSAAATLMVCCIGLWITSLAPAYWTALAFFLAAVVFEIAPTETIFSGFQTSTFWLLFSGLILGAAIRHTGLDKRAAALLSGMLGTRYASVISGIVLFALALNFVMPSAMGRIVLLVPIIIALADHMGYAALSNGRIGMLIGAAFGTWLPGFTVLPSNAPNMMLAGMAENLFGYQISYWDYLILHFPVLGAVKSIILIILILWMFPDRAPTYDTASKPTSDPMSAGECRLVVLLGLSLALWFSDTLHHILPGWIGLAVALCCLWPQSNLTSKKCINEEINYGTLLFVAGIMGLGAVVSTTGLGEKVVQSLSAHAGFSADQPIWNLSALTAISTLVAIATNLPGVPAVMTPIAENLADITGLPLTTVLMTQVLAFSNVFLPYQAPPLIMAAQLARLPIGAISKMCLALFAVNTLVLTPLDMLWWYFLGLL
ncbi:SLC13 family permease [Kiloniella sp.]|uniref:SLC13 family permease n=1 Tax=Kiloniella sp. TaxID=1938587 RepID=UPI003B017719